MRLLFFGIVHDIVGERLLVEKEFEAYKSVGELRCYLFETYPELEKLTSLKIAVNEEMVADDAVLKPNDTVAFIPPVSGG